MTITKLNYEVYALDYLEGTLSKEHEQAMERFLLGHPEIAMELEAMREVVPLIPDPLITFRHKEKLLKKEPETKVIFFRKWQLGVAAAITLLVAFASLLDINFFAGQGTIAHLDQATYEEKGQVSKEIPSVLRPTQEEIAKTETIVVPAAPRIVDNKMKKEITNFKEKVKEEHQKTATNNSSFLNPMASKEPSKINSVISKSESNHLALQTEITTGTTIAKRQERSRTDFFPDSTIDTSTRKAEEVATIIETKKVSNHPTVPIVAALPLSDKKEINGLVDFKKIQINTRLLTANKKELLADNSPKKRTLKSMLGKLPGDRLSVSILPSFFTDRGD